MWNMIFDFVRFHPGITLVGAFTLIQIAPIKLDPWGAIARWFRNQIVGEMERKLAEIEKKVDNVESIIEEREAILARTHILRFNDEVYNGTKHSKEYFDQTLEDIDRYNKYCDAHPQFKNSRTVMSAKNIQDTYNRLLEEHKFL